MENNFKVEFRDYSLADSKNVPLGYTIAHDVDELKTALELSSGALGEHSFISTDEFRSKDVIVIYTDTLPGTFKINDVRIFENLDSDSDPLTIEIEWVANSKEEEETESQRIILLKPDEPVYAPISIWMDYKKVPLDEYSRFECTDIMPELIFPKRLKCIKLPSSLLQFEGLTPRR